MDSACGFSSLCSHHSQRRTYPAGEREIRGSFLEVITLSWTWKGSQI